MSEARSASETVEDPIRVLVADDEETVVDVLRALIGSDPSLRFVGAAHNAEDAIEMTARERPDVVLLDVRMPGGGGLRATREITKTWTAPMYNWVRIRNQLAIRFEGRFPL